MMGPLVLPMSQGNIYLLEEGNPAAPTSSFHRNIIWGCLNRKFLLVCLLLLAMFYIPAYNQLAQPPPHDEELDGWPRNGTRNVRPFIQPENLTAIISPMDVCEGRQPFLLVVVCSAVQNTEARRSIRETWASNATESNKVNAGGNNIMKDVRVVFLLGDPDNSTSQTLIEEESKKYGDIVQENFRDSYNNLTLKSVMLLKWVTQKCGNALYVMKTDDDTMVNLRSLQSYLRTHQISVSRSRSKTSLLSGNLICGARPILDSTHKWYMPRYIFSDRTYPNYLSGSGYVMSQDVVKALYSAALEIPLIPLEDVYITGQCAQYAGIRPSGHLGFSLGKRPMTACALGHPQVITTHRLNPKEMREAWELSHAPMIHCNKPASTATPSSAVPTFLRGPTFGRRQRFSFNSRRNPSGLGCF